MLMKPAFEIGRPSTTRFVSVIVVLFGIVRRPLPLNVPLLHVIAEPVSVIGAVPAMVPKLMAIVGMVSVDALLSVSKPLVIVIGPVLVMLLSVTVAPEHIVAPALYAPLTVFVPPFQFIVPSPLMFDAASNVRVSPV